VHDDPVNPEECLRSLAEAEDTDHEEGAGEDGQ